MVNDINLDSSVSNYAVFGNPIKHSKSPQIHTLFARQTDIPLHYQAIEVPSDRFDENVRYFASLNGKGLNITVPFKEEAYALCDSLTPRAKTSGSVNTIWFDEHEKIYGDTTDGKGLINDLTINHAVDLKNKSILILGAGGSVKAILEPICEQNPKNIIIANRTVSRAEELANIFTNFKNIEACSFDDLSSSSFDIIINGTSLSLAGELPPISSTVITSDTCCYDLMYSDTETIFMSWCSDQGASKVIDGLGMLVEQAAESFLIWHGVKPETAPVIKSLRSI